MCVCVLFLLCFPFFLLPPPFRYLCLALRPLFSLLLLLLIASERFDTSVYRSSRSLFRLELCRQRKRILCTPFFPSPSCPLLPSFSPFQLLVLSVSSERTLNGFFLVVVGSFFFVVVVFVSSRLALVRCCDAVLLFSLSLTLSPLCRFSHDVCFCFSLFFCCVSCIRRKPSFDEQH